MQHPWFDPQTGTLDDAAVLRPTGATRPLVTTMDVITPIVDDAYIFGQIAAANALSDVYAMGGRPEMALMFLGCPVDALPEGTLNDIIRGIRDTCQQAHCSIVGGHTMKDSEPKCGLAVIGSVDPNSIWSQRSARPGDILLLTKPLGTGLIGQSVRAGKADPQALAAAIQSMTTLNDIACKVGQALHAHACTDITGFGLLGHLRNLVEASQVRVQLQLDAIPTLPGVLELAKAGCVPGGSRRNLDYARPVTHFDEDVDEAAQLVLADAQTSGGLLLSIPGERADDVADVCAQNGLAEAAIIGHVREAGAEGVGIGVGS